MERRIPGNRRGFSLVELLAALAIGAGVITVGVLIFQNLTGGSKPQGSFERVTLGASVVENFYGLNQAAIDVWVAPNFGRRAQAELLRDQFWTDVASANAVFCLGRAEGVLNETHPTAIAVDAGFLGQSLELPDDFRTLLAASVPSSAATFSAYRGVSSAENASIFILQPSDGVTELSVLAVYDIDMIATTTPPGIYASVRRYEGDVLTDFYDVFYPSGIGTVAFNPVVVAFERMARLSVDEGSDVDRLKVAEKRPFYFIWWPDPAMPELKGLDSGSFSSGDPRASYPNMGSRTALFFAVPMFPAL